MNNIYKIITGIKFFRLLTLIGTLVSMMFLYQKYCENKKALNE